MSKEVGANGLISLGKEHAGKRFEVVTHTDGRVELIPVQVATAMPQEELQGEVLADGWTPPGGYAGSTNWERDNRLAIEQYARRIDEEGTAADQLQQFLAEHPELLNDDNAY